MKCIGNVGPVALAALVALTGCVAERTGLNVGGVWQPEGPPTIRQPPYSFRFVDKWRITHNWIQGTGIPPCQYGRNIFKRFPQYPTLGIEPTAPMFERDGLIYGATTFERDPNAILFTAVHSQIVGNKARDPYRREYTPFCTQVFMHSRNGMSLYIVKPDSAKGTDEWLKDAVPTKVNGLTWWVRRTPAKDLNATGELWDRIEDWTLKIPDTPYWMHLGFSASLNHSIQKTPDEHRALLALFHRVIDSVTLEPITPVPPEEMPPFVLKPPLPPYVPSDRKK